MNTYVEGRYFSSDEEMEVLKNPPERMILKRLSDAYPARRTAKQLEEDFRENTDIVKSTIHAKLIELRKKFFIYELNKKQEAELKRRRGPLGPLHDPDKKETPTSAKYVIEEVSNSLYRILPYHLAPGYVQYNEHFETAWNHIIKNQLIEKELFDNLRRSLLRILETIFGIVNNSESQPMEISRIAPWGTLNPDASYFCSNCGIDHEARNFVRAILLHLLDDVEMTHDFIDFFKKHGIVNTHGYEKYEEAYKKFSHETKFYDKQNKIREPMTMSGERQFAVSNRNENQAPEAWFEGMSPNAKKLIERILIAKPEITKEQLMNLLDAKKRKIGGGYLTDQGAAFLVGADLGISLGKS